MNCPVPGTGTLSAAKAARCSTTAASYLPELRDYLDTLLRTRERVRSARDLEEWAKAEAMPSDEEITRLRQLIRRAEGDLDQLKEADRRQITHAIEVVRPTRRAVHLAMPAIRTPTPGLLEEGQA
jgi:rRNA maturation endonuclease Nob1